jgi:hypothetical protein
MSQPGAVSNLIRVSLHKVHASHGYIFKAHMNRCTLPNDVMVLMRRIYNMHEFWTESKCMHVGL